MWIDIVWLILAIAGIWKGWNQGLIISVFSVLAWGIGVFGAVKLCADASQFISEKFDWHSAYLPVVAFLAVFIILALIIYFIGKSLENIIEIAHLGFINKFTGAVLRVTIYTLVFTIFLWLINEAGLISPTVKAQSRLYDPLSNLSEFMIDQTSAYLPAVKKSFNDLHHLFEKISKEAQKL